MLNKIERTVAFTSLNWIFNLFIMLQVWMWHRLCQSHIVSWRRLCHVYQPLT